MKQNSSFFKRFAASALALTTALTAFTVSASAYAIDRDKLIYSAERPLADGLTYEAMTAMENGLTQYGYLFTYKGGLSTTPILTYGEHIRARETLTEMAALHEERDNLNIAGGINADFFSMANGIPIGVMIKDGLLCASDAGENAIGIRADGSVIIGEPNIGVTLHKETATVSGSLKEAEDVPLTAGDIKINHINKQPSIWGAYLVTSAFGKTTASTELGREIVFRLDEGVLALTQPQAPESEAVPLPLAADTDPAATVPSEETDTPPAPVIRATVTEVREETKNGEIPADGFVLVVHRDAYNAKDFADLAEGDTVTLSLTCSAGWEDVTLAVGGGDILISDGIAKTADFSAEHADTRNPRTAIGYTEDGTIRVFAVDGRTTASRGMTLAELARTMASFGCVGALNLDGGGSTTVMIRETDGGFTVENNPTDGYQRRIGNAILFVNTAKPASETETMPHAAVLTPVSPIVFRDSRVPLSVTFYDRSYTAMSVPDASITFVSDGGTVDENGYFIPASPDAGVVSVTADIRIPLTTPEKSDDGTVLTERCFTASTDVYKVDTLSGLTANTDAIVTPIGGTSAPITVGGIWMGYDVLLDTRYVTPAFVSAATGTDTAFDDLRYTAWGYIDEALRVHNTATQKEMETVSAISGFPTKQLALTVSDASSTHALYLPVTFGAAAKVVLDMEARDARSILRIPGDGTGAFSRLTGGGRNGSSAVVVSASGIAPVTTPARDNPVRRLDLYIKGTLPANAYLLLSHNGTSNAVLWQVTDDFTRFDGWKRISADLTALDANGLSEFQIDTLIGAPASFTLTIDDLVYHYGDDVTVFTDISASWAKNDILSVARMGVVGGIPQADGSHTFDPAGLLTRGAFAKMICVFAGLTTPPAPTPEELYPPVTEAEATETAPAEPDEATDPALPPETEPVEAAPDSVTEEAPIPFVPYLPFSDLADIPVWALPYIKAVTEAGYMRGKTTGETDEAGNPVTRFAANDTMTRAEVLQVLGTLIDVSGKVQNGSHDAVFADDAQIPDWARANIDICVSAGIIKGFDDNTIRPTATITRAEIAALLVRMNGVLS